MPVFTATSGSYLLRFRNLLRSLLFIPDQALDFSFEARELAQLHTSTAIATTASIDAQTWGDLLLDQYTEIFSEGVSIFGQQELYRRLRAGADGTECTQHVTRVKALMADPEQLSRLHQACQPLRRAGIEIAGLLFGPQRKNIRPAWTHWIGAVGPSFLVAIVATFIWPLAWVAVGIAFALLLAIRLRYIAAIEEWNLSMESLQRLLGVCSSLGQSSDPLLRQFVELRARVGQINRSLSRSPIVVFVPIAKDYLDWFMLTNVMHYFRCVNRVDDNIVYLRKFYQLIAGLEADIALALHLQATAVFCWADRHTGTDIEFKEVVNPLLSHGMPLSIDLAEKGAFISGQNGVGKSTLLRTIGLNLVVARAFGFCYARGAAVSTRQVYASMQNEDAMLGGESLYIAELRRASEMLASLDGPHGGIYIIDEIFRGTNHLESVSAAAAVLEELAGKGVVIVSSHNLVLAPLLAHCLKPLCVSMSNGDSGQLTLRPGVLVETNGISLLSERGFDARLQDRAGKVFNWLSRYLAHPTELGDIPTSAASSSQRFQTEECVHAAPVRDGGSLPFNPSAIDLLDRN